MQPFCHSVVMLTAPTLDEEPSGDMGMMQSAFPYIWLSTEAVAIVGKKCGKPMCCRAFKKNYRRETDFLPIQIIWIIVIAYR